MPNRLIHEHSLYLRQHAHNPVDWYPWGEAAFERAVKEHKPVLVSIGYAACHWCHVMERESFENEDTAAFMNRHFICIKVDREERPDVDSIYMDAVQAITGSGGWPLNVFVTPEKIPFYGGTYFPPRPAHSRASWMQVLERIHELWNEAHDSIVQQAAQMKDYLAQAVAVPGGGSEWDEKTLENMTVALLKMSDRVEGGFGRAPKFPGTMAIDFLLLRYRYEKDEAALQQAVLSLDKMAAGGIYDQLGGGFSRYSTDNKWLAPHFEKMLYDNALLLITFAHACRLTGKDCYRNVIGETISFVNRELKDAQSGEGFYSALDADSEGVEGKFYTFTWQEWQEACGDALPLAAAYFGVSETGNWEGTNILHQAAGIVAISEKTGVPATEVAAEIAQAENSLWQARARRIRPATDDKVLLSWNALMNLALTKCAVALGSEAYLTQAKKHMNWLLGQMEPACKLYHVWRQGKASVQAHLDDHAFLIQALLQLGSTTGEGKWITEARNRTAQVIQHFKDPQSAYFFFTAADQQDVPLRKVELQDNATPSGNAVMAHNLLLLGLTDARQEWLEMGEKMLAGIAATAEKYPYSFGYWIQLLELSRQGWLYATAPSGQLSLPELAQAPAHLFVAPKSAELSDEAAAVPAPGFFVCSATGCLPPKESWEDVLLFVNKK